MDLTFLASADCSKSGGVAGGGAGLSPAVQFIEQGPASNDCGLQFGGAKGLPRSSSSQSIVRQTTGMICKVAGREPVLGFLRPLNSGGRYSLRPLRCSDSKAVRDFRDAWAKAPEAADAPALRFRDLHCTAARILLSGGSRWNWLRFM